MLTAFASENIKLHSKDVVQMLMMLFCWQLQQLLKMRRAKHHRREMSRCRKRCTNRR